MPQAFPSMMMGAELDPGAVCLGIAADWAGDCPDDEMGGLSVVFQGDNLNPMVDYIKHGVQVYESAGFTTVYLLDQLRAYARLPVVDGQRQLPEGHAILVAVAIAYLQHTGALTRDDKNGMSFLFRW